MEDLVLTDSQLEEKFCKALMNAVYNITGCNQSKILHHLREERVKNYVGELKVKFSLDLVLNLDNSATIDTKLEYERKEKIKDELDTIKICDDHQMDMFDDEESEIVEQNQLPSAGHSMPEGLPNSNPLSLPAGELMDESEEIIESELISTETRAYTTEELAEIRKESI